MTVEEVRAAVAEIRAKAHDDEAAHAKEDALYEAVLTAIAASTTWGSGDAAELAREALKTQDIEFARWCA